MATIYSNRNDNASDHVLVKAIDSTTWVGGVTPVAADIAYVVGRQTTLNQSARTKWTGTVTLTVASTANFADIGFFYTVTSKGDMIKVQYTGKTATTFTGCSLDETDPFYKWNYDNTSIANGQRILNPACILTIGAGETFECSELYIQEGGWLRITDGGTLKVNHSIYVLSGRLEGRGAGNIIISRPSASLANMGGLYGRVEVMSIIDINGECENVYGYITEEAVKDGAYVTVSNVTNGQFAIDDEVTLYMENDYKRRDNGYTGYRDASCSFKNMDEGFDVCGIDGDKVYLALRNGARGKIKQLNRDGVYATLDVKPNSVYFAENDMVVINNKKYTIAKVEDSEVLVKTYDFTNPSTDLSDFWINDPSHVYSSGWSIIEGLGIRNTSSVYRELVNKHIWEREIVLEIEMSPRVNYYNGVYTDTPFGILTAYDPSFRQGLRGFDSFKANILEIGSTVDRIGYYQRSMTNYPQNRITLSTDYSVFDPTVYRIDNRKGESIVHINGVHFTTEYLRHGGFKGLVGIFSNSPYLICKSLTIKYPTQRLYIQTNDSFIIDHKVYRTGIEWNHPVGSKLLKIASINTGNGSHKNLAFGYSGQNGSGEWPIVVQQTGVAVSSTSAPYLLNHDMNVDYEVNLGDSTSQRSITIDLGTAKRFTHISFVPRLIDASGYYGMNGIAVYGSNDLSNWTTLRAPTNDTLKWSHNGYNRMAYYNIGTATFRYVKFETAGSQHATVKSNRYVNIGVHDFTEGFSIALNNASDFKVGDKITVLTDCGYGFGAKEIEGYQAAVTVGVDPETYYHGGWLPESTIISKDGDKIFLDKPIFWGYIEDKDSVTVVRTSRKFTISGTFLPGGGSNAWSWPQIDLASGSSVCRLYLFRNVLMKYIGSYRYSGSSSNNRGFLNRSYDYWNATINDGCVHMMGPDGTTWSGGIGFIGSHSIARNNVLLGHYTAMYLYYTSSHTGIAMFNNKVLSAAYGVYSTGVRNIFLNYNEIANVDVGIDINELRTDRMIVPNNMEIRRNYVRGTMNTGIRLYEDTTSPYRFMRVKIENNKLRGMDDSAIGGRSYDSQAYVDSDFLAEHTGARLSRYRDQGILADLSPSNDLVYGNRQINFGRYGYDLQKCTFYIMKRDHKYPDIYRFYNCSADSLYYFIGIELDIKKDGVPFNVHVEFEYRLPGIRIMQDDGTDDGAIRVLSIQNGTLIQTQTQALPMTLKKNTWYKVSLDITNFAAVEGRAGVFVNSVFLNGYLELKNGNAYVTTNDVTSLSVVANTFKLRNLWDQYREIQDIRKINTGQPTKFINVKF